MTAVPFPISIGLVGAPGSGKQAIGEKFAELSYGWWPEGHDFRLIGNAGNVIEDEYDRAMGVFGSWDDDLRAYHLRYEAEQRAIKDGASFLSLGTAVENIAHCGINLENIMVGLSTPEMQALVQRQQVTMTALTFLFLQGFRYTFGFYVPHSGKTIILPGQDDSENSYNQRIDGAIRTVFGNFGVRIQVLDEPTIDEKAQVMFETVRNIVENGVPEPEVAEEAPHEEPTLTA